MAAAEARAVWQRTANRCFVPEDAKRAPKLACCQSSSSSSNKTESGPHTASDGQYHPAVGLMHLNRSSSYSSLPPDARWWLQLQPTYGYQKGLTHEQIQALETEVQALIENPTSEGSDICRFNKILNTCAQDKKSDRNFLENYETVEDCIGCPLSKKTGESPFDPESPWTGAGKKEPWWRTTDSEELASLVAQKSLDHIENCDLPPPQKMNVKRHPYAPLRHSASNEIPPSFSNDKGQTVGGTSIPIPPLSSPYTSSGKRRWTSTDEKSSASGSNNSFSPETTLHKDTADGSPSKSELLEALRHSQTRAREAEEAAHRAYEEKEHVVKLFFKQASQLFAYKQWFQLLQLESLYTQIKNNEQVPMVLPWTPHNKGKKQRKNTSKGKRQKPGQPRHDVASYAVAFALGLSLVGAGLLLGWTAGWLLPM
ncbi:hypothetical protein ACFE04_018097 [Oxalis oulophora]